MFEFEVLGPPRHVGADDCQSRRELFTFLVVLLWPGWVATCVWIVAALGFAATIDYTLMLWRERDRSGEPQNRNAPA